MKTIDLQALQNQLTEEGYAVIENVLDAAQLEQARARVAALMAAERAEPFPLDDERHEDDDEILAYYKKHYTVSDQEARRMVARIHQYRRDNQGTRWPVPISKVSKNFLHLPTLFDDDKSQRIWNLLNKAPDMIPLIEHPQVLPMVRHVMGADCNLHDFQATSIGLAPPAAAPGTWTRRWARSPNRCRNLADAARMSGCWMTSPPTTAPLASCRAATSCANRHRGAAARWTARSR